MRTRLSLASILLAGSFAAAQAPVQPVPYPYAIKPTTPQATLTGVPALPAGTQGFVFEAPSGVHFLRFLPLTPQPAPMAQSVPFSCNIPAPSTKPKTRVFEVADLVAAPLAIPGAASLATAKGTAGNTLVKFLAAFAKPESWERRGGAGKIEFIEASESLCVTSTPEVLAEVEKLLAGLRRLNDQQVSVEYRLLTLPANHGLAWPKPDENGKCAPKFLSPTETEAASKLLQSEHRKQVVCAPKLTILDGQTGLIELGDRAVKAEPVQRVGCISDDSMLRIQCSPTISPDAKSVRIKTDTEITRPGYRMHAVDSVALADGHSVVHYLGKQTTTEAVEVHTVPQFATIPYLNRVFKSVGIGAVEREVYQITTVRILKPEAKTALRLEIEIGK